jgi:hypothetical protein
VSYLREKIQELWQEVKILREILFEITGSTNILTPDLQCIKRLGSPLSHRQQKNNEADQLKMSLSNLNDFFFVSILWTKIHRLIVLHFCRLYRLLYPVSRNDLPNFSMQLTAKESFLKDILKTYKWQLMLRPKPCQLK